MPLIRADDRLGVVYTPREVCEPMVRRALAPLVQGRTAAQILALRVCDPAIGEGAFLVEIVRVLADALALASATATHPSQCNVLPSYQVTKQACNQGIKLRRLVAERCLHGVDIDARAVAAARIAVEEFVGAPIVTLRDHLRVGDALAVTWDGEFDAVVGNPPYVRQERLGAQKPALRGFETYDGAADLYVYFVELAHRIVRRGGRYCLIVPNKWMTAAYGRRLREYLARAGSVEGVVDFGRALFDDVDAFPCVLWGTVGARSSRPIRAVKVASPTAVALALDTGTGHPRGRWRDGPWHIDVPGDAALIDRLARASPQLGDVVGRPARGVVTGCNRAFVIDAATRDRLVDAEPAATAIIRPFVKGRDVRRWRAAAVDRFVLLVDRGTSLDELPGPVRRHLAPFRAALEPRAPGHPGPGRKPGSYRWYELQDPVGPLAQSRAPRLFYQDIQTAPACSLDSSGELVADTTVWILPSADRFVLAVLNSSLYAWYARRRFPPALNGAVRPKLEYMRALPIATPSSSVRTRIEALVDAQLASPTELRDRAIDDAVLDAYELSRRDRALIRA